MKRALAMTYLVAFVVSVFFLAPAQSAAQERVPTQAYIMSFHSCVLGVSDCNNPRNHIVQLAQSADGASWSMVSGWQSYLGSVPDAFRRGNTLYIFSTSGLVKIDMTTGAVNSTSVTLSEGMYVDPSVAQLPDGRLILFYLPGIFGQDPAGCAPGESSCVRQIRSAVEVAGSDGSRFTVDSGARISETISQGTFSDPDIFYNGTKWVLYVSRGPSVYAYTSDTVQGSYVFHGIVSQNLGGIGSAIQMTNGSLATYVHSSTGGGSEIRRAISADGTSPITSFQTTLTAQAFGLGNMAESPGIALNAVGIPLSILTATPTPTASASATASATPTPTASASATPSATPTPTASASATASATKPAIKSRTITCIKGKLTKKVTAINPKCSAGYKQK